MSDGLTPISTLVDGAPAEIIRTRPGGRRKYRADRIAPKAAVTQDEPADPRTLEEWLTLPLDFRDDFAARVMYEEYGNHKKAAARLGFSFRDTRKAGAKPLTAVERAERARILTEVFGTPGVAERLTRTFKTATEARDAIIERLKKVALSADDDKAVRAAQTLAKMEGWNKEVPVAASAANLTINLAALVSGMAENDGTKRVTTIDQQTKNAALKGGDKDTTVYAILGHEPGAPSRFGTEAEGVTADDDEGE